MSIDLPTDLLRKERDEAKDKNRKLEGILRNLLDWLEGFVVALRVTLYFGSILLAWFYLHDHVLAVAIAIALTVAHLLMEAKVKVNQKQKELLKW